MLKNVSMESNCPDETAHAQDASESGHFAHVQWHSFAWRGPFFHETSAVDLTNGQLNKVTSRLAPVSSDCIFILIILFDNPLK